MHNSWKAAREAWEKLHGGTTSTTSSQSEKLTETVPAEDATATDSAPPPLPNATNHDDSPDPKTTTATNNASAHDWGLEDHGWVPCTDDNGNVYVLRPYPTS